MSLRELLARANADAAHAVRGALENLTRCADALERIAVASELEARAKAASVPSVPCPKGCVYRFSESPDSGGATRYVAVGVPCPDCKTRHPFER